MSFLWAFSLAKLIYENLSLNLGEIETLASLDPLEEMIAAARGELEVDLLLEGADIANLLSGEVQRANVANVNCC